MGYHKMPTCEHKVSRINVYDVRKTTFVPTAQAASVYSNNVHCTASTSSLHHHSYTISEGLIAYNCDDVKMM